MRLWTLHPKYLDSKGLVALWREALLAQKVLKGETIGYRHHPQLKPFKATPDPVATIATYLVTVHEEATRRGYHFDYSKIESGRVTVKMAVTESQVLDELEHLRSKFKVRDYKALKNLQTVTLPEAHPSFKIMGSDAIWVTVPSGLPVL